MLLLAVPGALLTLAALLVLAAQLEQRRVRVLVRLAVRPGTSPEVAERILATDLAPLLRASGLDRRVA